MLSAIRLTELDPGNLGDLDALRDWGHARDFVQAMWLMLQQPEPDDFVIATGRQISVREFVDAAFLEVGIKLEWRGRDLTEVGIDTVTGKTLVAVDPRYFRPTEVDTLLGDPSKAKAKLGWQAETSVLQMVKEMVSEDKRHAEKDELCKREGYRVFDYFE